MNNRAIAVAYVKRAIGSQMLALRQIVKSSSWPQAYELWLTGLQVNMRRDGFDEAALGVKDLADIVIALVEEAVKE